MGTTIEEVYKQQIKIIKKLNRMNITQIVDIQKKMVGNFSINLNYFQEQAEQLSRMSNIFTQNFDIKALNSLQDSLRKSFQINKSVVEYNKVFENLKLSIPSFSEQSFVSIYTANMKKYNEYYNKVFGDINLSKVSSLGKLTPFIQSDELKNLRLSIEGMQNDKLVKNEHDAIQNLYDVLHRIPDSVYDTILENEECSRQEIKQEAESLKNEKFNYSNVQGKSPEEMGQLFWNYLWEHHPHITYFLFLFVLTCKAFCMVDTCISINDNIISPIVEKSIVYQRSQQNTYFVRVKSAKIYEEPNSHSKIISKVLYGDEISKTEDVKMWIKIEYKTEEGKNITGWIAKRNLMTYRDYEFHQDKLYE